MTWLVIGVDPGPIPGIVGLYGCDNGRIVPSVVQCDPDNAVLLVRALLSEAPDARRLLAVEQFVVGLRASRSSTPTAGVITRNLISVLRATARGVWGIEFIERPAGAVKPWATDKRLDAAGLLAPTKGMLHARDAARHALYAAVADADAIDPLSKNSPSAREQRGETRVL